MMPVQISTYPKTRNFSYVQYSNSSVRRSILKGAKSMLSTLIRYARYVPVIISLLISVGCFANMVVTSPVEMLSYLQNAVSKQSFIYS